MKKTKEHAINLGEGLLDWNQENVLYTYRDIEKIEETQGFENNHAWHQFKFTKKNGDVTITQKYFETYEKR